MGADNTFGETNFNPDKPTKKVQWSGYGELGNISQKPPSPSSATAEEILQKYMDMSMIICPLHVVPRTVALDAMHEFAALQNKPQPTAEGAEQEKILTDFAEKMNTAMVNNDPEFEQIVNDHYFDLIEQPTSEGAEDDDEIILGEPDKLNLQWSGYGVFGNCKQRQQPTSEGAEEIKTLVTQWEQFKNERWWNSEAIDVLAVLINEFSLSAGYSLRHDAALHAQKIADKMVEERLEIELIKYDTWLCSHSDVVISKHYNINEYLKSREK